MFLCYVKDIFRIEIDTDGCDGHCSGPLKFFGDRNLINRSKQPAVHRSLHVKDVVFASSANTVSELTIITNIKAVTQTGMERRVFLPSPPKKKKNLIFVYIRSYTISKIILDTLSCNVASARYLPNTITLAKNSTR